MDQRLSFRDREFKKRLDEAKGHFGTATTQTQISQDHRWGLHRGCTHLSGFAGAKALYAPQSRGRRQH